LKPWFSQLKVPVVSFFVNLNDDSEFDSLVAQLMFSNVHSLGGLEARSFTNFKNEGFAFSCIKFEIDIRD
jgi:hypothetical protein